MNHPIFPIKIEPVEKFFRVNWRFDIRCNYDCCYCATEWHDLLSPIKSLPQLKHAWTKIFKWSLQRDLPMQISFTGGEPTVNKNFLPLIEWIYKNNRNRIAMAGMSTNGSAPAKVYLRLIELLDYISFSIHSEFFDENKFFSTVIKTKNSTIGTKKRINVSIMDEPWNRHRFNFYKKVLDDHDIDWKINYINWDYSTSTIPIINKKSQPFVYTHDEISPQ
jgi:organic radical activating enzyme